MPQTRKKEECLPVCLSMFITSKNAFINNKCNIGISKQTKGTEALPYMKSIHSLIIASADSAGT